MLKTMTLEERYAQLKVLPGYETVFILRSDVAEEVLVTVKEKMKAIVESFAGQWAHEEDWGKRKFAYPMQKETRGHYFYFVYTGRPGVVAEIERNLRISDKVLRFLTVRLDNEFDVAAFQAKAPSMSLRLEDPNDRTPRFDRSDRGDRGDRGDRSEYRG